MKSIYTLVALSAIVNASSMISGPCPSYSPNLSYERLNHTAMGGLWYEYTYTNDYRQDGKYECASWNLLAHSPNTTYTDTRYDLLHHSMNKTTNDTGFNRFGLTCGAEGTKDATSCVLKT